MLFTREPFKDSTGRLVFRYPLWMSRIAIICSGLLLIMVIINPPDEPVDIIAALVLIFAALFMAIQTAKYHLIVDGDVIKRCSPWYWEERELFSVSEFPQIDIKYKAFHATLKSNSGDELQVPFLLCGAFRLIRMVAEASDSTMTDRVRKYIERYS